MTELTEIEQKALELYEAPFTCHHIYIYDAKDNMVTSVRGWGRISYMKSPGQLQDAVGSLVAKALTEYWEKCKEKQNNSDPVENACEIRLCQSGKPKTFSTNENIGDSSYLVKICEDCAEALGCPSDLPDADIVESKLREYYDRKEDNIDRAG